MAELEPIRLLVLGPMRPAEDGKGALVAEGRTVLLKALVETIVEEIRRTNPGVGPVPVDSPDDNPSVAIVPGVLEKIEAADLVICDLTGGSPNVMYELGLVHALGIPYVLVTGDDGVPFYFGNYQSVLDLRLSAGFDPGQAPHRRLLERIAGFLNAVRDGAGGAPHPEDFARNPASEYFNHLPIVHISAPVGLAAGYWVNSIRRFTRDSGYFESPPRTVHLQGQNGAPNVDVSLPIRHFVSVRPIDGLKESYGDDFGRLQDALRALGYGLVRGAILQAIPQDLREFGAHFLGRLQADGTSVVIEPGILVEIPTTLYALQHSPRIRRIDDAPVGPPPNAAVVDRLRRRRYSYMLDRFGRLLQYYMSGADAKGHLHQVHYVGVDDLPALLERLVSER
ncbi:MAG TPA: hypothetical protein VKQ54_03465 [Caulobacteraceae bacterium]|nr:hypothetical protein [Caulobacteraceae bacterium]